MKKKLSNHFKSRDRKREKLEARLRPQKQPELAKSGEIGQRDGVKMEETDRLREGRDDRSELDMAGRIKTENEPECSEEFQLPVGKEEQEKEERYYGMGGYDEFMNDRPEEDLFFGGEPEPMGTRLEEAKAPEKMAEGEEGAEFEQPNLANYEPQLQPDYDSSDSSMITDEEDSDY